MRLSLIAHVPRQRVEEWSSQQCSFIQKPEKKIESGRLTSDTHQEICWNCWRGNFSLIPSQFPSDGFIKWLVAGSVITFYCTIIIAISYFQDVLFVQASHVDWFLFHAKIL
jgi:hypothetical protein